MKKKIIIIILSIFLLILPQSIPAIEFNNALNVNQQNISKKIIENNFIFLLVKIKDRKDINDFSTNIGKTLNENFIESQSIIGFLLLRIILNIFFGIISKFIDILGFFLENAVTLIITILKPLIKIFIFGLIFYFSIAAIIDLTFLIIFFLLSLLK